VQLEGECAQLRQERVALQTASERKQRELGERINELEQLLQQREGSIKSRDAEIQKMLASLQALQLKHDNVSADLNSTSAALQARTRELQASREEEARLRELLQQMQLNLDDLRNQLQYKQEADDGSSRQEKADWLLKSLAARLEESRKALDEERSRLQIAEETIVTLKERIKELQAKVNGKICSVCGKPARDQIAPKPEKPVGVGMRITEHAPHRVTELVPNGPAALSKKIRLQDRLIAVNRLHLHEMHDISRIRSQLLGAKGSIVVLQFERDPTTPEASADTFNVSLVRS
jgi:Tfp pilus assembly protein FimV